MTESQIVAIVKEADVGMAVKDIGRQYDVANSTQNGYIERFNRTYRHEVLDLYWFKNLQEVKQITDEWIEIYNTQRPHDLLNDMTPIEYRNAA